MLKIARPIEPGNTQHEDSKVLGEGSGAKTGVFFIRQVQIHEGLCPVMCCVRVCVSVSVFCFVSGSVMYAIHVLYGMFDVCAWCDVIRCDREV